MSKLFWFGLCGFMCSFWMGGLLFLVAPGVGLSTMLTGLFFGGLMSIQEARP